MTDSTPKITFYDQEYGVVSVDSYDYVNHNPCNILELIKIDYQNLGVARVQLFEHVEYARKQGFTWKQIGDALEITRQAAQQRYGRNKQTTT
jgi:hypothetical protein